MLRAIKAVKIPGVTNSIMVFLWEHNELQISFIMENFAAGEGLTCLLFWLERFYNVGSNQHAYSILNKSTLMFQNDLHVSSSGVLVVTHLVTVTYMLPFT